MPGRRPRRIWHIYHPESECAFREYDPEEVRSACDQGCDIISVDEFLEFENDLQDIPQQSKAGKKVS